MIIDNEDFELKKSNCYWAGRLLDHPQQWEIANEIVEAIEYAIKQIKILNIPDVINYTELEPEFRQALDDLCKKFNKPTKKRF